MFKIVSTAAIAALFASTAMAKAPPFKILGGQYIATTQYTALIDSSGLCGPVAGLAAGQVTTAVATFTALGDTWTETIANANGAGTSSSPYGVGWVNCQFPALPAASAFTATAVTGSNPVIYTYTAKPSGLNVSSCVASTGTAYTLTSQNGSNSDFGSPVTQTLTYFGLPSNKGTGLAANDSGFKVTTTNSELAVGGNPFCYLSIDSLFLATQK